jgi:hypothetical protein
MLRILSMTEHVERQEIISQYLPFKDRLWLAAFLGLFAFGTQMYLLFDGRAIFLSSQLGSIMFWGTIIVALLLPLLRFPNRYYGFFVPLGILIVWYVLLNFFMPPIVAKEAIARAALIIPTYEGLKLETIKFNPGVGTDVEPSVVYVYHTDNPHDDYQKLHDFYKEYLLNQGWDVNSDWVPTAQNSYSLIDFKKLGDASTRVTIYGIDKRSDSDSLRVVISF